jgi:hypothetical protein
VRLVEDEHVVEQLTSQGAREALSERVHVRRADRGTHFDTSEHETYTEEEPNALPP